MASFMYGHDDDNSEIGWTLQKTISICGISLELFSIKQEAILNIKRGPMTLSKRQLSKGYPKESEFYPTKWMDMLPINQSTQMSIERDLGVISIEYLTQIIPEIGLHSASIFEQPKHVQTLPCDKDTNSPDIMENHQDTDYGFELRFKHLVKFYPVSKYISTFILLWINALYY